MAHLPPLLDVLTGHTLAQEWPDLLLLLDSSRWKKQLFFLNQRERERERGREESLKFIANCYSKDSSPLLFHRQTTIGDWGGNGRTHTTKVKNKTLLYVSKAITQADYCSTLKTSFWRMTVHKVDEAWGACRKLKSPPPPPPLMLHGFLPKQPCSPKKEAGKINRDDVAVKFGQSWKKVR